MRWFKFYGQDWLTDLKIRRMSLEDKICFVTLLCLASAADENGLVRGCDEESLISLSNLYEDPYDDNNQVSRARGCLKRYETLQCVTLHDNGDVTVVNFGKRQSENLSNAERQKKYRENKKAIVSNPKTRNTRNVTHRNDSNARVEENRIDKNRTTNNEGFEKFWATYPKKVGKGAASNAWSKLRPNLIAVLTALEVQKKSDQWNKDGGQYIPNPATWLNQSRWLDEVSEVTKSEVLILS